MTSLFVLAIMMIARRRTDKLGNGGLDQSFERIDACVADLGVEGSRACGTLRLSLTIVAIS